MKYVLIDEYFQTPLFQRVVKEYFDTVFTELLHFYIATESKGDFKGVGYHDMPYTTHILNGLIPTLHIFEEILLRKNAVEEQSAEILLKILILGFSFHDANKVIDAKMSHDEAVEAMCQKHLDSVKLFFPEIETHKTSVFYLASSTEDRSMVHAQKYRVTISGKRMDDMLRPLCHLADGLASIQEVETPEMVASQIRKKLIPIENNFDDFPISYVQIRPNPYVLLSQKALQTIHNALYESGKKGFYSMRSGFIYFGTPITEVELANAYTAFDNKSGDLDEASLTDIDYQKCKFGFIGSIPFTKAILAKVVAKKQDSFLALSPNSAVKIKSYDLFVELIQSFLAAYGVDTFIGLNNKDGKCYLRFSEKIEQGSNDDYFRTIYCLNKVRWLNGKFSSKWRTDFEDAIADINRELANPFELGGRTYKKMGDVLDFLSENTSMAGPLMKTLLNFDFSYKLIIESEDVEQLIESIQNEIIGTLDKEAAETDVMGTNVFLDRYLTCEGTSGIEKLLAQYEPEVSTKDNMCAFTGETTTTPYEAAVAFGLKARGFSNRSVTFLGNDTSYISDLFVEENMLRISNFTNTSDANTIIYNDFFETNVDISRDIIKYAVKAKPTDLSFLEKESSIQFDKTSTYQPNLFNLSFTKIAPGIEGAFYLVRKSLSMIKLLGVRTYITGIMSSYMPHKHAFCYENAPKFLVDLGWDRIRLAEVDEVRAEIRLMLTFGNLNSTIPKLAQDRRAYFTLFYMLNESDKEKVRPSFIRFIDTYGKQKFNNMTIIEELVELATKIERADLRSSGSQETWLIRTATDFLRQYVKIGSEPDDIIQKIAGELYRVKKHDNDSPEMRKAIEAFSAAIYHRLFEEAWKGKLPLPNQQKHWIYQFAFMFKKRSDEIIREFSEAKKAREAQNP